MQAQVYIETIMTGLVVFPFLALFITFPYILFQYHKFGAVSKLRVLIVYSFVLYMLIAYFMVILPLPSRSSTIGNAIRDHIQLKPLYHLKKYYNTNGYTLSSFKHWITSFDFLQLAFNVLLTVPFGVYMHYYFKKGFFQTLILSFLLSAFYEGTQVTALYGIYPGPYRLADVDDLICNTMGGVIGYILSPMFVFFLPSREKMDLRNFKAGSKVSGLRRFWALLVDLFIYSAIYFAVLIFCYIKGKETLYSIMTHPCIMYSGFILMSYLETVLFNGKTIGKASCRMQIIGKNGRRAKKTALTIRYLVLFMQLAFPSIIYDILEPADRVGRTNKILYAICVATTIVEIFFYLQYIYCMGTGKHEMPHAKLSSTKHISTLHEAAKGEHVVKSKFNKK